MSDTDQQKITDLLDHVEHNTDAARHCVVEIEPGEFVVTRTRDQAARLKGALAVLRAQAAGAAKPAKRAAAKTSASDPDA